MLVTDEWKKERLSRAYSGELNVPESMNRATQAMFWEHRHGVRWKERGIVPIYNLGYKDHNGTLSMRQIYLQCTTEYEAAMVLLGRWDHWERLCNTPWFPAHLEKWKEEKAIQEGALGRNTILELAAKGNLSAAKYLDQERQGSTPSRKPKPAKEDDIPEEKCAATEAWLRESLAKAQQ